MNRRTLQILWPAFLAAGVLTALVFAAVDPGELHWFGGVRIEWSADAVYSFTFLLFWAAIASAGALTALLTTETDDLDAGDGSSGQG